MIGYLKGKIIRSTAEYLVIVVNGVGYQVFVNQRNLEKVSENREIELHIHHYQTEKSEALYGFENLAEISLFEALLSVSGVGPKVALALISALSVDELEQAITKGEVDTLTTVPGIGKKGAQKIIAELSDNLADKGLEGLPKSSSQRQAYDALIELGYNSVEAKTALRMISKDITDPEDKVKEALKHLS